MSVLKQGKNNQTVTAASVAVCGVLLLIAAVGSLILYCRTLELRLDNVLQESLISHTVESGERSEEHTSELQSPA